MVATKKLISRRQIRGQTFEKDVAELIERAFEFQPGFIMWGGPDTERAQVVLRQKSGNIVTPDMHYYHTAEKFSMPVEIKRGENGFNAASKYLRSKAQIRTGVGNDATYSDTGLPRTKKVILISAVNEHRLRAKLREFMNGDEKSVEDRGVHPVSIFNLEQLIDHFPDELEINKNHVRGILEHGKHAIIERHHLKG